MEINLLFPVLNEHKRLENGIEKTVRYMQMYVQKDPSVRYLCTILDNGSTDDTPQIGAALAARHPGTVEYVRIEEKGVGIAFRTGDRVMQNRNNYQISWFSEIRGSSLRKSGTEPVLRVMSEAGSIEECEKQVDSIIAAMEKSGHLVEVKK